MRQIEYYPIGEYVLFNSRSSYDKSGNFELHEDIPGKLLGTFGDSIIVEFYTDKGPSKGFYPKNTVSNIRIIDEMTCLIMSLD
jgi:hypothetical protein